MRLRFVYSKRGRICFLPHVETPPLFCRAFRRSGHIVSLTGGLSPHPRISLGPALPVGVPGLLEPAEIWLEKCDMDGLESRVSAVLPEGVTILSCRCVEGEPSLNKVCHAARYEVYFRDPAVFKRVSRMIKDGWEPLRECFDLNVSDGFFAIVSGSPGQVGPGAMVRELVSGGVVDSWADLFIVRTGVGRWDSGKLVPLSPEEGAPL